MSDEQAKPVAVIAAGGTGGHTFPAQALAEALEARGWHIVLLTDKRGRTYTQTFPHADIYMVDAATLAGRSPLGKIKAVFGILKGIASATGYLRRIKPDVIVGFGGYPSLPALAAGSLLRLPTMIHDQNGVLGRVNKAFAPYVDAIATAFPDTAGIPAKAKAKTVLTGNPVRSAVARLREAAYSAPRGDETIRLLIFGGSQGARVFSERVPEALTRLPEDLRARLKVVQQCREETLPAVKAAYNDAGIEAELAPFFADLPERLQAAHLVIGRAGASTVTELATLGRPGLLVPLPSAMDDHQSANAESLAKVGGAWRVSETEFTAESLAKRLADLLADPTALERTAAAAYETARPRAAERLADLAEALARAGKAGAAGVVAEAARASQHGHD